MCAFPLLIGLASFIIFQVLILSCRGLCIDFQFTFIELQDMMVFVDVLVLSLLLHIVPLLIGSTCMVLFCLDFRVDPLLIGLTCVEDELSV